MAEITYSLRDAVSRALRAMIGQKYNEASMARIRKIAKKVIKRTEKRARGSHRRWITEGRRLAARDYVPVYSLQSVAVSFGEETISPPSADEDWIKEIK